MIFQLPSFLGYLELINIGGEEVDEQFYHLY